MLSEATAPLSFVPTFGSKSASEIEALTDADLHEKLSK